MLKSKFIKTSLFLISSSLISIPAIADNHDYTNDSIQKTMDNVADDVANIPSLTTVKAKFAADSLLNPFDIKVSMEDRTAVLSGKVDTDMQFDRAVYLTSSVEGIDDVNTDGLSVKDSKHPVDDMMITGKVKGALIKAALLNEKEVDVWPFKIETQNGEVFVQGEAKSQTIKDNVLNVIRNVNGVKSVRENITIKAQDDAEINMNSNMGRDDSVNYSNDEDME